MDGPTLKRLGMRLQKEIVPLHDLPFPMREALRKLAEKYDHPELSGQQNDARDMGARHGDDGEMNVLAQAMAPKR